MRKMQIVICKHQQERRQQRRTIDHVSREKPTNFSMDRSFALGSFLRHMMSTDCQIERLICQSQMPSLLGFFFLHHSVLRMLMGAEEAANQNQPPQLAELLTYPHVLCAQLLIDHACCWNGSCSYLFPLAWDAVFVLLPLPHPV